MALVFWWVSCQTIVINDINDDDKERQCLVGRLVGALPLFTLLSSLEARMHWAITSRRASCESSRAALMTLRVRTPNGDLCQKYEMLSQ